MDQNSLISATLCVQNDEDIIEDLVRELSGVLAANYKYYEILIVDNHSTDHTVERVRAMIGSQGYLRLVVLSRTYDPQIALTSALEQAIGDYVVCLDARHAPVGVLPEMVSAAMGGSDVVTCVLDRSLSLPLWYRIARRAFYRFSSAVLGQGVEMNWSHYFCLNRKMVNSIIQVKDRIRNIQFIGEAIGYEAAQIRAEAVMRSSRRENINLLERIFFAIEMVFSNSERPLRFATMLSLMASGTNCLYLVYTFSVKIFMSDVAKGWASTSTMLASMFALLFFIFFVIGEYVLLVYKESKKGPLYHIKDEYAGPTLFDSIKSKNVT